MILVPLLAHLGGGAGFWSVFAVLFIYGFIAGVNSASVFEMTGGLPFKYMGVLMLGFGISGLTSNVLRAISLWIWPVDGGVENAFIGALVYYLVASIFVVTCGFIQFIMSKNEFAIYHLWQHKGFEPPYSEVPSSNDI